MHADFIRERLARYQRQVVDDAAVQRAAVALILRQESQVTEFLAIHRSEREGDPWSGHMAFPGGRQHAADRDLHATAIRETLEEVGIDLERTGESIGCLDDLRAIGNRRRLDLVISPCVYLLNTPVTPVLNPVEVQKAIWIPLVNLRHPDTKGTYRYMLDGFETHHDAFVVEGHAIWGLTYRILDRFLDVLA